MTKRRMFYETMEDVLPDMKVIIDDGNGNMQTMLPLDSFTDPGMTDGTSVSSNEAEGGE